MLPFSSAVFLPVLSQGLGCSLLNTRPSFSFFPLSPRLSLNSRRSVPITLGCAGEDLLDATQETSSGR